MRNCRSRAQPPPAHVGDMVALADQGFRPRRFLYRQKHRQNGRVSLERFATVKPFPMAGRWSLNCSWFAAMAIA